MKFVLANRESHPYLLRLFREKDPFNNVKIISKEELYRDIYYSYREDTIIYLMKEHHYSYEVSKMYLDSLAGINSNSGDSKIGFLYELKNELISKELLVKKEYSILKNGEASIYGYSENDFELVNALKSLNIKYNFISNSGTYNDAIYVFDKAEEEVIYVLNEIAHLIDSGINIKDIKIIRRDSSYDYYLKKFSPLFGYQLNLSSSSSLASTGACKEFLRYFNELKDIDLSLEKLKELMKDDETYLDIEEVAINSKLEDTTFEIQYDYLSNKLLERKIRENRYLNAVDVLSNPMVSKHLYYFVLGFSQGTFPKSGKDNSYLSNNELHMINRLNVKDKTRIDELVIIDFLKSDNVIKLFHSSNGKTGKKYFSSINKILDIKEYHPDIQDYFYSSEVLKYLFTSLYDNYFYYKDDQNTNYLKMKPVAKIDYNTYDNSLINFPKVYDQDSFIVLSTSSLEKYSQCPFNYYLDSVLRLDAQDSTFYLNLGNLAHHIFETMRDDNFDFEAEFDGFLRQIELKASEKYLLNGPIKAQLKLAVESIKLRESHYTKPKFYNEEEFKLNLNDKTIIKGRIDNLVTLNNEAFICVDYKTGSTKFDTKKIPYGVSTQLPTYTLLVHNDNRFKDLKPIGLYINNVLTKKLKDEKDDGELIPSYLKLNGKTIGDLNYALLVDDTLNSSEKSQFVSSLSVKKSTGSLKSGGTVGVDAFDEYMSLVTTLYTDMDKRLRNNDFSISPLEFGERDSACQYCSYRDVCYVRGKQVRKAWEESDEQD